MFHFILCKEKKNKNVLCLFFSFMVIFFVFLQSLFIFLQTYFKSIFFHILSLYIFFQIILYIYFLLTPLIVLYHIHNILLLYLVLLLYSFKNNLFHSFFLKNQFYHTLAFIIHTSIHLKILWIIFTIFLKTTFKNYC